MKTFALAALVGLLTTGAYAADIYVPPAEQADIASPASAYDWTGFYVGVHGGYGWWNDDVTTTLLDPAGVALAPAATNSFSGNGLLGGVQAGYNFQMDQFVFGIEGEYSASAMKGEFNYDPLRPEATSSAELTGLAAVKARAGVAFDQTLLYATAGYATAWSNGVANNVLAVPPAVDAFTGSVQVSGYVLGAGVEQAMTKQISLKAEYDYYNFAQADFNMTSPSYPGVTLKTEPKLNLGVVKAGINFHF